MGRGADQRPFILLLRSIPPSVAEGCQDFLAVSIAEQTSMVVR